MERTRIILSKESKWKCKQKYCNLKKKHTQTESQNRCHTKNFVGKALRSETKGKVKCVYRDRRKPRNMTKVMISLGENGNCFLTPANYFHDEETFIFHRRHFAWRRLLQKPPPRPSSMVEKNEKYVTSEATSWEKSAKKKYTLEERWD